MGNGKNDKQFMEELAQVKKLSDQRPDKIEIAKPADFTQEVDNLLKKSTPKQIPKSPKP